VRHSRAEPVGRDLQATPATADEGPSGRLLGTLAPGRDHPLPAAIVAAVCWSPLAGV